MALIASVGELRRKADGRIGVGDPMGARGLHESKALERHVAVDALRPLRADRVMVVIRRIVFGGHVRMAGNAQLIVLMF